MRSTCLGIAVLLAGGCGSTRPIEVPPPFNDGGIIITVKPRAYVEWPLETEWIRGTVENRTGRDVDLLLYLNLVDDRGRIVGHALAFADDFPNGESRGFNALPSRGPLVFDLRLFERPPAYSRVTRGFVWDQRAFERLVALLSRFAAE